MNKAIRLFNEHCLKATERTFQAMIDWFRNDYKRLYDLVIDIDKDLEKLRSGAAEMNDLQTPSGSGAHVVPMTSEVNVQSFASGGAEASESKQSGAVLPRALERLEMIKLLLKDNQRISENIEEQFDQIEPVLMNQVIQSGYSYERNKPYCHFVNFFC